NGLVGVAVAVGGGRRDVRLGVDRCVGVAQNWGRVVAADQCRAVGRDGAGHRQKSSEDNLWIKSQTEKVSPGDHGGTYERFHFWFASVIVCFLGKLSSSVDCGCLAAEQILLYTLCTCQHPSV